MSLFGHPFEGLMFSLVGLGCLSLEPEREEQLADCFEQALGELKSHWPPRRKD